MPTTRASRGELEAGLLSQLDYSLCWLLNRMDKNVMQSSVEARVPFLEPDGGQARVEPAARGEGGTVVKGDSARRRSHECCRGRSPIDPRSTGWRSMPVRGSKRPRTKLLHRRLLRETLRDPRREFEDVITAGNHVVRVRLWSGRGLVPVNVRRPLDSSDRARHLALSAAARSQHDHRGVGALTRRPYWCFWGGFALGYCTSNRGGVRWRPTGGELPVPPGATATAPRGTPRRWSRRP